jgi:ferredoxin-like protein FixX
MTRVPLCSKETIAPLSFTVPGMRNELSSRACEVSAFGQQRIEAPGGDIEWSYPGGGYGVPFKFG